MPRGKQTRYGKKMASTIARARGCDRTRIKEVHRLGSRSAWAQAATWRTFATAEVFSDGSGYVDVRRDGELLHVFLFQAEETPSG